MTTTMHCVARTGGELHVEQRKGSGPPLVLMHGFPDDHRIYDRLMPHLAGRHTVRFDFAGYGRSSRQVPDFDPQLDLLAVLDALGLDEVVVVGHDASGPVAINAAITMPDRIAGVVLLNCYYDRTDGLRFPEMIQLLAEPALTPLADAMFADADQRMWLLAHTARQFGNDPFDPEGVGIHAVVPQFFGDPAQPDALDAIRSWTAALWPSLDRHDQDVADGTTHAITAPVTLAFGTTDPYLSPSIAEQIASRVGQGRVHPIDAAGHWPQWDRPEFIAELIATAHHDNR